MASKGTADARDAKWSAAAQPLAPGVCHKRRCDEHRPLRLPWPDSARCVHFAAQEGPRARASYSARREDLRGDPPSGDQAVAQGESSLLHAASRTDLPREVRLVTAGGGGGSEKGRGTRRRASASASPHVFHTFVSVLFLPNRRHERRVNHSRGLFPPRGVRVTTRLYNLLV